MAFEQSPLASLLGAGLNTLDLGQQITFQVYTRVVLPVDGFVFWTPTVTRTFAGSLHFSQDIEQEEDETVGLANVTFTTQEQVTDFAAMGANTLYVASFCGFRFAFAHQHGFYEQANLWHYSGRSIYPALATQLLASADSDQTADGSGTADSGFYIDPTRAVTSNSLALWLALNTYEPIYADGPLTGVTLYPSGLAPLNIEPPYGTVHIAEDDTRALQPVPYIDQNSASWQLAQDRVRIVLYGLQSNEAIDFLNAVIAYSSDTANFGITNMPIVRDGKRAQPELQAIAMRKVIDFEVSYPMNRVQEVARQLILSAIPTIVINPDGVLADS